MNLYQLLILQIIAHLLSDYTFQWGRMAADKNKLGFKSKFLKWHILVTFCFAWLLSFQLNYFFGAAPIAIIHWIVDGTKKHINKSQLRKYAFFIDQSIHLITIGTVVLLFDKYIGLTPNLIIPIDMPHLFLVAAYLFCTKPANIFIKETFVAFNVQAINIGNDDLPNAGKLIGIVERFLVLTFIVLNQFQAVGFLIAAKSILRFKDDSAIKTEYVLIGTMLSFGIAIGLGIATNLLG